MNFKSRVKTKQDLKKNIWQPSRVFIELLKMKVIITTISMPVGSWWLHPVPGHNMYKRDGTLAMNSF